jgi:hypothetical protein
MQKRDFIVKELNGEYELKEIDPTIAKAMHIFGVITGEYHSVETSNCFFYFCPMTASRANEVAAKLSQELLQDKSEISKGSYKNSL